MDLWDMYRPFVGKCIENWEDIILNIIKPSHIFTKVEVYA